MITSILVFYIAAFGIAAALFALVGCFYGMYTSTNEYGNNKAGWRGVVAGLLVLSPFAVLITLMVL